MKIQKLKFLKNKSEYLLPMFSGVLAALAFPPLNLGWISLFALVPFLFFLKKTESAKKAFFGGAVLGFVYFLGVLFPLTSIDWWAFQTGPQSVNQKVFFFISWPLFAMFGSLFFGAASLLFFRLRRKNYFDLILFPAVFVLLSEFLRSVFVFKFTWGFLGYSLHNVLFIRQFAAFGGIYLLSFLAYFFNILIFYSFFGRANLETEFPNWKRSFPAAAAVIAAFLVLNYGSFIYYERTKEKISAADGEKTVAVLQGNIKQSVILPGSELNIEKWYLNAIGEAVAAGADILVLPESVVPGNIAFSSGVYFPSFEIKLREKLEEFWRQKLAGENGTLAVFGSGVLEDKKNYNALIFADAGGIFGKYFKRYLVPFGEYRPFFLAKLAPKSFFKRDAGAEAAIVENGGVKYGGLICQEAMYPGLWRDSVLAGADVLINAGNDGIFGSPSAAKMMEIMAKIRAIETGRFVVRSMKTGVSAVFEPTGDEIIRAGFGESALLFAKIKPLKNLTLYAKFGNWVLLVCGIAVLLAVRKNDIIKAD